MIVKAEFGVAEIFEFRHFSRILDEGTNSWKYASFKGVEIAGILRFYGHLGIKKASQKDAIFRNSRVWKGMILVQNVKNQFLH